MVRSQQILARSTATEDFRWAARAAEAEIGRRVWWELPMTEQTGAIYRHLQKIDVARAAERYAEDGRPFQR